MIKRSKRLLLISIIFIFGALIIALSHYTAFFSFYRHYSSVKIIKDIVYVPQSNNPKQRLDLYLPKDKASFPIVHFVHGGYWYSGDKNYYQAATGLYGNIGIALARRGVGVAVQNYRLSPEVAIDEQINDVVHAVDWTIKHGQEYGGNGTVVLMGHSAGGHLVALLGSDSRYLQAEGDFNKVKGYIPISPVLDLNDMVKNQTEEFNDQVSYVVFGKSQGILKKYSPATYFKKQMPPMLFIVGENDFGYIEKQVERFIPYLRSVGARPQYQIIKDNSHMDMVTTIGDNNDKITPQILDFLKTLR